MAEPKPKDDKTQKERFIEKAREVESDEPGEEFEKALKKIVPPRRQPRVTPS